MLGQRTIGDKVESEEESNRITMLVDVDSIVGGVRHFDSDP